MVHNLRQNLRFTSTFLSLPKSNNGNRQNSNIAATSIIEYHHAIPRTA
jgi:hypothetical protein